MHFIMLYHLLPARLRYVLRSERRVSAGCAVCRTARVEVRLESPVSPVLDDGFYKPSSLQLLEPTVTND